MKVRFYDGGFDKPLIPEQAYALAQPPEMVQWAPSAVNKQPWRVAPVKMQPTSI